MSKFQKYTNNNIITVSADTLTEGYLTTKLFDNTTKNSKKVFFGLQADDGNFIGTLGDHKVYSLTSNYSDCNAQLTNDKTSDISFEDMSTVRPIYLTIPISKETRTITFSYNGTPLFNILQKKESTSITYTYKVFIRNIGSNGVYPSIVSNGTLTDSPSSWSAIKIKSSIYPLCTMECYYTNSSDPYPDHIYMSNLYIAGENKAIKYYDGEEWNYGYTIKLFYFTGQNCKLQGTYNLPFGKTNDDQHFDI